MDKKLIDRAWRILPAEFKRIVKAHYAGLNAAYKAYLSKDSLTNEECDRCKAMREKISIYSMYFGHHNLISDAEGEELLSVKASVVKDIYDSINKAYPKENAWVVKQTLEALFGSKCLPDNVDSSEPNVDSSHDNVDSSRSNVDSLEPNSDGLNEDNCAKSEPNPTEPKESPRQFYRIIGTDEHGRQVVTPIPPEVAGPYDIPEERTEPGENHIPDLAKMVDNIIRDGFSKERRLNVAAMAMQGYLSSNGSGDPKEIAHYALAVADALIKASEKGGEDGND